MIAAALDPAKEKIDTLVMPPRLSPRDGPIAIAAGYPERFPVLLGQRPWERPLDGYNPPFYESPSILLQDRTIVVNGYADPADVSKETFVRWKAEGKLFSYEGDVQLDPTSGRPLNPWGRTGICGRGALGKWGANQAADALITRTNPLSGEVEVLLVERDCGALAIVGGMLDPGETARQAMGRELTEETGLEVDSARGRLIYQGKGDGPRTTDNAWVETSLYHTHLTPEDHAFWKPPVSSSEGRADWYPITHCLIDSLYSNHRELFHMAVAQLAYTDALLAQRIIEQMDAAPGGTTLTSFANMHGKIAIFGGTFDPIHAGHVYAGQKVARALELDALVYLPAQQNPIKTRGPSALAHERFEMIQCAVSGEAGTFVSPVEIRQSGPSFTVETLREIRRQLPSDSELFFIIGSDCLMHLTEWREIEEVRRLAKIVPVLRIDASPPDPGALARRLGEEFARELLGRLVTLDPGTTSSSLVRERIMAGLSVDGHMPPRVLEYIGGHHLYDSSSAR